MADILLINDYSSLKNLLDPDLFRCLDGFASYINELISTIIDSVCKEFIGVINNDVDKLNLKLDGLIIESHKNSITKQPSSKYKYFITSCIKFGFYLESLLSKKH